MVRLGAETPVAAPRALDDLPRVVARVRALPDRGHSTCLSLPPTAPAAVRGPASARAVGPTSFRLAHLSDLHLGPMPRVSPRSLMNQRVLGYLSWQRRRYRVHRREVLDALVDDLQHRGARPRRDHRRPGQHLAAGRVRPGGRLAAPARHAGLGHRDPRQPRRLCRGEVARGLGALVGLYARRRRRQRPRTRARRLPIPAPARRRWR